MTMLVAYLTVGVGLLVLAAVVLVVLTRLRRFSRAADRLRGDLARGAEALPSVSSRGHR